MADMRFFHCSRARSLNAVIADIGYRPSDLRLQASIDVTKSMITGLDHPRANDLSQAVIYLNNVDGSDEGDSGKIGLCLLDEKIAQQNPDLTENLMARGPVLILNDPKTAFIQLAHIFYTEHLFDDQIVHFDADIAPTARLHPSVVVGSKAHIGQGVTIGPGAIIGPGVIIGDGSIIESGVTITHAILGKHCVISTGVRIGQAGFGVHPTADGLLTVPHLGSVKIGARVEIGANTTIDRGVISDTRIGDDTRIDNLVQIAHNVIIGKACLIAAQAGFSGSCVIGDNVMIGGQVGLADHLSIGDGAQIVAQAGIMHNVPPGEIWGGSPAKPMRKFMREVATLSRLTTAKKNNN